MPRCRDPAALEAYRSIVGRLAAVLTALLLGSLPETAAADPPYRGRALSDVLNEIGGADAAPRLQLRRRSCANARAGRADGGRRACTARAAARTARPRGGARRRHRLCRRAPDLPAAASRRRATPVDLDAARGSRRREQPLPSRRRVAARPNLPDPGRARGAAAARRRLAQGRAPPARAASNGFSGLAYMRGGEQSETLVVFDGLAMYEPFHLRLRVEPDERARPARPGQPGGVRGRLHRGVRRPHQRGHRRTLDSSGGRSLLRGGHEPIPHERTRVDALCRRSRPVARSRRGAAIWTSYPRWPNRRSASRATSMVSAASTSPSATPRAPACTCCSRPTSRRCTNDEDTECADADYSNSYVWGTLDHRWSPALASGLLLSYSDVTAHRSGTVDDPGRREGFVDDDRDYDVYGARLDARYSTKRWLHRAGRRVPVAVGTRIGTRAAVTFEPDFPFPGDPGRHHGARARTVTVRRPHGALRNEPAARHGSPHGEVGLRWDEQTYVADPDEQFAPRINVAYEVSAFDAAARELGRGSSRHRASTSCRSRMASTSSSRRSVRT